MIYHFWEISVDELESLYISDTEVSDLSALSNMTNLKCLVMSSDKIVDLSPLSGLENLEELSF